MDIGKSLNYVFEDSEWPGKLGLGVLITVVPILSFAWTGYVTEIMRNVAARSVRPLPTWDDLGGRLADGFYLFVARLIYAMPGIVLLFAPVVLMILPALSRDSNVQSILALIGGTMGLFLFVIWMVYLLALSFFLPAVQLNYARNRTFGACFQISQIIQLVTANLNNYLVAWIVMLAAYLCVYTVLAMGGSILSFIPCIGFIFSLLLIPVYMFVGVWLGAFSAHLFGQVLAD